MQEGFGVRIGQASRGPVAAPELAVGGEQLGKDAAEEFRRRLGAGAVGQLQPEDRLEDRGVEDVLDEGYSPPERETDHLRHPEGGESLDERLADEEPEVWALVQAQVLGQQHVRGGAVFR